MLERRAAVLAVKKLLRSSGPMAMDSILKRVRKAISSNLEQVGRLYGTNENG